MQRLFRFVRQTSNVSVVQVLFFSLLAGLCSAILIAQIGSRFTHLEDGDPMAAGAGYFGAGVSANRL